MRPKKTVLCVFDNEELLSVRKYMLQVRGFKVQTAESAPEAVSKFNRFVPDVVLVDLHLSDMNGNKLIVLLKELIPEIPMILTSDKVGMGERAHRADIFLGRGFNTPEDILERVKVLCNRKRGPKKFAPKCAGEDHSPTVGETSAA